MLKIRLMRIGAKRRPFYRVVVVDERNKRNGAYVDLIGTYNPLTTPHDIKLDKNKLEEWLKKGAQKSDGVLRILKEAPQRHRKPKKESEQSTGDSGQEKTPAAAEGSVEETKSEEPTEELATAETTVEDPAEETKTEEANSEEPQAEAPTQEEAKTEEKA